ncbi:MAG: class I SAM-dependent methyltransferase [Niabella sp.]
MDNKSHWEKVYETKSPGEVIWTQAVPQTSLNFIHSFNISRQAAIIDIGGGDSRLVDFLLEEDYENITVLDISEKALQKAKERLGKKSGKVKWIVSDITSFRPPTTYDVWHDRATFHFLTTREQVSHYLSIAGQSVSGYMAIGTFSTNGPQKCSGLPIQYNSKFFILQLQEK